ncbi:uncharacterized protein K489DRAFT_44761 [Dissoconium aciculare CBS 342.82]|uniref:Uncharacterized protein n=1 Tax=Dissoconium aciculare CBS 342.82 TaxID=1314786 RepID=A0A6J3LYK7_9PEZI|nr:uncharacterized protein K489DRAFT_44761 [Dissoconium aciculare CBS 342.82]KAF1820855.1 hypothetical protein K489DRAFT_44761 [Dissoconium aciculare CBS 342.82]
MADQPGCMCLETSYVLSVVLSAFPKCVCLDLESPSARLILRAYRTIAWITAPFKHFFSPPANVGIVERFNGVGILGKISVAGNKIVWSGPVVLDSIITFLTKGGSILFYLSVIAMSVAFAWTALSGRSLSASAQKSSQSQDERR